MILDRVARDEEPLGKGARVESCDDRGGDVALAFRERIGATEEFERLGWSCASKRDGDLSVVVSLKPCSLDHHPPPVDGTFQRVGSNHGVS
jgi:hypothetical protein